MNSQMPCKALLTLRWIKCIVGLCFVSLFVIAIQSARLRKDGLQRLDFIEHRHLGQSIEGSIHVLVDQNHPIDLPIIHAKSHSKHEAPKQTAYKSDQINAKQAGDQINEAPKQASYKSDQINPGDQINEAPKHSYKSDQINASYKSNNKIVNEGKLIPFKNKTFKPYKNEIPPQQSIANKTLQKPSKTNANINTCKDKRCSSLLSRAQQKYFRSCEAMALRMTHFDQSAIPVRCVFREPKGNAPVGLVSVPGSGNTWVRGLLEKATGICTGSIYCDVPLRNKGFVGEFVQDDSVLVVKSHTSDYQWKGVKLEKRNRDDALYGSAILLIRNPFETFVSERHRIQTLAKIHSGKSSGGDLSHVKEIDEKEFGDNKGWDQYVRAIGERWGKTIVKWVGSAHRLKFPILIIHYDDLLKDSLEQVIRILEFLEYDYDKTELATRLEDGFRDVQRKHTQQFEHYTAGQKVFVRSMLNSTMQTLQSMNISYKDLKLEEYWNSYM